MAVFGLVLSSKRIQYPTYLIYQLFSYRKSEAAGQKN